MSDEKDKPEKIESSSSNESGNTGAGTSGNEIPYVPPNDRTNLSDNVILDIATKTSIPPGTKANNE